MNIAFLTREYPPDTLWGGEAVVYYNLTRELAKRGHEVHVICQAVAKPKDSLEEGVYVHRVGTIPQQNSVTARVNYTYHAWRRLKRLVEECGIDLVEASYWSAEGLFYSLKKKRPLIVKTQSSPRDAIRTKSYAGTGGLLGLKILSHLAVFAARRADIVIANSRANYAQVLKEIRINPNNVRIVHHAIDTEKYKLTESDIKAKLGIPLKAPTILCVGRLEARKGFHILCQALPEVVGTVPKVRCVLVGRDTDTSPKGGSFKQYMIEEARRHNFEGNLVFVDFLPENELIRVYSACDVFVSCSLHESFGLPVIEAMCCGKPVVATTTGIVPELEPYPLKGLKIVPIGNRERLCQAILEMLALENRDREEIGRESREFVEREFSLNAWLNKMIGIYEDLMPKKVKGG